ncbi:hypothetical protein C8J57DRAFT_1510791 [Mycena rebaudengoi]|nr:hypothetical protein C8J57DRAFT_1510791 [Mycena rebaudengoi]
MPLATHASFFLGRHSVQAGAFIAPSCRHWGMRVGRVGPSSPNLIPILSRFSPLPAPFFHSPSSSPPPPASPPRSFFDSLRPFSPAATAGTGGLAEVYVVFCGGAVSTRTGAFAPRVFRSCPRSPSPYVRRCPPVHEAGMVLSLVLVSYSCLLLPLLLLLSFYSHSPPSRPPLPPHSFPSVILFSYILRPIPTADMHPPLPSPFVYFTVLYAAAANAN